MSRRPRGERGLSESLQWSVLYPLVLLMIVGIIQAGVLLHGRTVVAAAALAGAEAQALAKAGDGAARSAAEAILAPDDVQLEAIEVGGDQATVTVRVVARVPVFLDFGQSRVEATATQPREQ